MPYAQSQWARIRRFPFSDNYRVPHAAVVREAIRMALLPHLTISKFFIAIPYG